MGASRPACRELTAEHAASREDMMSVQPLRKDGDRNPRTAEEAKALVKHVETLFMPWNIDALVGGFTDDCVVRFGTVPEFRGREALRAFFAARTGLRRAHAQQILTPLLERRAGAVFFAANLATLPGIA
jgi:hypothetical protein